MKLQNSKPNSSLVFKPLFRVVQALVALLPLQHQEYLGLLGTRSEDHKSVEEKTELFEW